MSAWLGDNAVRTKKCAQFVKLLKAKLGDLSEFALVLDVMTSAHA